MGNNQLNQIFIQGTISLLGILLTAALTYYFSQKRYTYEKLFDRKLSYLEEIYSQAIDLEKGLKKYVFTIGGADMKLELLPKKIEEIALVQSNFFALQDYFWKKEIILDKNSIEAIQSFIDTSIEILSKLQASILSQSQQLNDGETAYKQWDASFQLVKDKLSKAKKELKEDFRKTMQSR